MGKTVGKIKSVNQFLGDCINAFKDHPSVASIGKTLPWAGELAKAAGQAVPAVAVIIKFYEDYAHGKAPLVVGVYACSGAMMQAVAEAISAQGPPRQSADLAGAEAVATALKQTALPEPESLEGFSWLDCRNHPFVRNALAALRESATVLGYDESECNQLCAHVNLRFPDHLRTLLYHRDTANRLQPFAAYLDDVDDGTPARIALRRHADLVCRRYNDTPLFNQETFALSQIYMPTQCGVLTWGEIRGERTHIHGHPSAQEKPVDPFDNQHGGCHDLCETLVGLMADPDYREPIVLQGMAGSGKSSFTLHLSDYLVGAGLAPILIRLRDVDFDPSLSMIEALRDAVTLESKADDQQAGHPPNVPDLFEGGAIWRESGTLGGTRICRYVLILDGWDEISISSDRGFKQNVTTLLNTVRRHFISKPLPVRVIVTGRPSQLVEETGFLRRETKILTLRPLEPAQVEAMTEKIKQAQALGRFPVKADVSWDLDTARTTPLVAAYEDACQKNKTSSDLMVMGSPLLAFLAIRLVHDSKFPPAALVENPTLLYRELVDLTCEKGGQPKQHDYDPHQGTRFVEADLRRLLHDTAVAMFIRNQDNVSFAELEYRLTLLDPKWRRRELIGEVHAAKTEHPLMDLMVSYFFKSGNQRLGCEFMHKSFREYLFAEAVVTRLKRFGLAPLPDGALDSRNPFWLDANPKHPVTVFAHDLSRLLAGQWLSREIHQHLFRLLKLTIREDLKDHERLKFWNQTRDGLAMIWQWWVEKIPQRLLPQYNPDDSIYSYPEPFFCRLSRWFLVKERLDQPSRPLAISDLDAHLGDALIQITAMVHFEIAKATGWLEQSFPWAGVRSNENQKHQVFVGEGEKTWVLFSPDPFADNRDRGFRPGVKEMMGRINAATGRPEGPFPQLTELNGICLSGIDLSFVNFTVVKMSAANFYASNLDGARLVDATLDRASLVGAKLSGASLDRARLDHASLDHAKLFGATLDHARLVGASLEGASLDRASLVGAKLSGASLDGASLDHANLICARLDRASLYRARLKGASLDRARLDHASLDHASLVDASLDRASLIGASLFKTKIKQSSFKHTKLKGANFKEAELSNVIFTGSDVTWKQLAKATCRDLVDGPTDPKER